MDINSIVDFIKLGLVNATPIALGAYSGLLCERSGVVNIAIEGMMLIAACVSQLVAQYTFQWIRVANGSPAVGTPAAQPFALTAMLLGLAAGLLIGVLLGWVHAHVSIRFKANQIISGTVINILALGLTGWLYQSLMVPAVGGPIAPGTLPTITVPLLSDIPVIGSLFFVNKPIVMTMLVLTLVLHYAIFFTPWGLRTRAVGEHPKAADTVGINVFRTRYTAVILGGLVAGMAGTWLTIENIGVFNLRMTTGRGFIALAALIFGRWTPFGAFGAAMLFGFGRAVEIRFAGLASVSDSALAQIPSQLFSAIPYLLTVIALAGIGGRALAPAADGVPYEKESSEEGAAAAPVEEPPKAPARPAAATGP